MQFGVFPQEHYKLFRIFKQVRIFNLVYGFHFPTLFLKMTGVLAH